MSLEIIQIVRRFGPVGGMERYVWEVSRELADMGHQVYVLCEIDLSPVVITNITIYTLGVVSPKPRWLAHIRFSQHVSAWLKEHQTSTMIIHSHERTAKHHLTTFHGPPFAMVNEKPCWKRLSLRVYMNLWLEKREICEKGVQYIIPNSQNIAKELAAYYPSVSSLFSVPILPGVTKGLVRPNHKVMKSGGVIGFIGKEWKRKGLLMAINILSELVKKRPDIVFLVAGSDPKEILLLFSSVVFKFKLLGNIDVAEYYQQLDVLLHPAINEPFGMVVTEALASHVPVVISDVCGAATEVQAEQGSCLSLEKNISDWVDAVEYWLCESNNMLPYQRSWRMVAEEHENLYQTIELSF